MKKTVLLIEDDKKLLKKTRDILQFANFKVLTSQKGMQGMKLARKKQPDIILSNISFSEMDGNQIFDILRTDPLTRRIPVIFMSASNEPFPAHVNTHLESDEYLSVPFTEKELLKIINNRLAKSNVFKEKILDQNPSDDKNISNMEQLRSFFRNYGEYLEIDKNEEIFREGRHASYIYLVEEGLIKIYRLDEYGKELITWLSKKEDILGFYSFKIPTQYPESAEALEDTKLFRISSEEFIHTLLKSQELTVEFAQLISENLSTLKTHLLEMAYGSVLKKTTNTILEFAEKIQNDPKEFIKISRSDLASVAGISTESFIRSLSCLKKEGLIDIVGRDIKILNLQKLHSIR